MICIIPDEFLNRTKFHYAFIFIIPKIIMSLSTTDEVELAAYRREKKKMGDAREFGHHPISLAMLRVLLLYEDVSPVTPTELRRGAEARINQIREKYNRPLVTDSELDDAYNLSIERNYITCTGEVCELTDYGRELGKMLLPLIPLEKSELHR